MKIQSTNFQSGFPVVGPWPLHRLITRQPPFWPVIQPHTQPTTKNNTKIQNYSTITIVIIHVLFFLFFSSAEAAA